jgi:hypothetical protein
MITMGGAERIHEKIRSFRKKYYLNIFVRGALLSLTILISYFLVAIMLEYNLWLSSWARFLIFFTFFGVAIYCLYRFLKAPIEWWLAKRGMSEEESAKVIGNHLPTVKDRLLNLIQLLGVSNKSALAFASVEQKTREFEPVSFENFIDLNQNRRYLKYLVIPVVVVVAILVVNRSILTQSTSRIVHFSQHYSPQAPFKFIVGHGDLNAFFNENFTLNIELQGAAVPEHAYIVLANQRLKLDNISPGQFSYVFENVQEGFDFQVEAAGFFSDKYDVSLLNRPELSRFHVSLSYPPYLNRKNESLANSGNLEVPEGTEVRWQISTANASHASIMFGTNPQQEDFQATDDQAFTFKKRFKQPDTYEIVLKNEFSQNRERIAYSVNVIKDEFPKIEVNNFKDSVLYKMLVLSGVLSDDYGIRKLALHYKVRNEDQKEISSKTTAINIAKNQTQQSYFYPWALDSIKLSPGNSLEYFLEVWDNDGVNGSKSTKTSTYTFYVPTEDKLVADINSSQTKTQQKIDQSVGKANKLQDQIEQANQKLKGKQNLDWQDKKMLEDILEQKQSLNQLIEELKDQNRLLDQKKDAFTEQDERIREKAEQIQKLMDELLDEETKKLLKNCRSCSRRTVTFPRFKKSLTSSTKIQTILKRSLNALWSCSNNFSMSSNLTRQ